MARPAVRSGGPTHAAFLRGLNVGGKNALSMAALAEAFCACGCDEVSTLIQSGNVLFRAPARVVATLAVELPGRLHARHGVVTPLVLRTLAELGRAAGGNPFLARGVDPAELHVAFLAARPTRARAAALDPRRSPGDAFELCGRELYLHLPNGVARTKLTNAYLDATLGTVSTLRNWRTIGKLLERVKATREAQ